MDAQARRDLMLGWRVLAVVLIYPITVRAGLSSIVRIVSGCCLTLDSWTPEGALGNLALGFPALAGLAALWLSTIRPIGGLARDRGRFLLVTTGLLTGLVMEGLFLRAALVHDAARFRSPGGLNLWTFAGPLLVGVVNLALLIRARERAFAVTSARPHTAHEPALSVPHVREVEVLQPVNLRPYRRDLVASTIAD